MRPWQQSHDSDCGSFYRPGSQAAESHSQMAEDSEGDFWAHSSGAAVVMSLPVWFSSVSGR